MRQSLVPEFLGPFLHSNGRMYEHAERRLCQTAAGIILINRNSYAKQLTDTQYTRQAWRVTSNTSFCDSRHRPTTPLLFHSVLCEVGCDRTFNRNKAELQKDFVADRFVRTVRGCDSLRYRHRKRIP